MGDGPILGRDAAGVIGAGLDVDDLATGLPITKLAEQVRGVSVTGRAASSKLSASST